jgi:glycosyltransferase involved in cell wall biosynthesis
MKINPDLTIIMPVYNEQDNLPRVMEILSQKLSQWVKSYEILIVDDGSTDRTVQIAGELAQRNDQIRVLRHPENRGPGSGIITGLAHAMGDLVTFIPADLAISMDQFPRYLEAAKDAELVIGIRSDRSDYSLLRKINSHVYIWLIKLLFQMKHRQFNYVHLYHRHIFDQFDVWSDGVFITAEIMIRGRDHGFTLKEVEIDYVPRTSGKASCGNPSIIMKTFGDLIVFWLMWVFRKHHKLKPRLSSSNITAKVRQHESGLNNGAGYIGD